jgi:hypothetical protein
MEQVSQESQYDWLMFIISQYPYNVHRIDEYCNKVYRGFQRIDEELFATCFNAWCKTIIKVYDIDNGSEILNYDAMSSLLNIVGKLMRLPHGIQIHQSSYCIDSFQYNFDGYCDKKKNRLLVKEIMNEIKVVGQEYRLAKENFISSIKEELIKKAWHPNRVMLLMNQGINPDDM